MYDLVCVHPPQSHRPDYIYVYKTRFSYCMYQIMWGLQSVLNDITLAFVALSVFTLLNKELEYMLILFSGFLFFFRKKIDLRELISHEQFQFDVCIMQFLKLVLNPGFSTVINCKGKPLASY